MTRLLRAPFTRLVHDGMRRRGLGLREFCRSVGLDPSFLSKVLSGKRSPPSDEAVLRRMALALGIDPAGLIVSAGRIPNEWKGLCGDERLVEAVHRLVTGFDAGWSAGDRSGSGGEPRSATGSGRTASRRPKAEAFGEELL